MKKIIILLFVSFTLSLPKGSFGQNVGIGTTTPNKLLHLKGGDEVLRLQGVQPWIGFMNNTDVDYGGFLFYPDTSLVMGSRDGTNLPLIIAPNNIGLLYATSSQRIGIGSPAPTEKLDVNGNINLTGTIKANGVDGTANQVLMKNSSGNLAWGDMCEYKNIHTIASSGSGTWTVPAGVTKVLVEVVAGGGGGNSHGGGGGGGYIKAILTVTPGSAINYTVGAGGSGSAGGNGIGGGHSQAIYGSVNLFANGGGGATFDNTTKVFEALGGQYVIPSGINAFIGEHGDKGKPNKITFEQKSATSFFEISSDGNGGGPGNCKTCMGEGTYIMYDISAAATVRWATSTAFKTHGAGGGGGYTLTSFGGFAGGGPGSPGIITFYY